MSLIAKGTTAQQSVLALWRIDEEADDLAAQLERKELYYGKVFNLKPEGRRMREVLATRCLLKEVAGRELGLMYRPDGAPYLPDGSALLSITHTDGYVAVIYHPEDGTQVQRLHAVGIDIEKIGRRVGRVVEKFLMPDEVTLLDGVEAELQAAFPKLFKMKNDSAIGLHLAWCAKETAFKVLGQAYFDLQHKTRITRVSASEMLIDMQVEGMNELLQIHFDAGRDWVLTWIG